MEKNKMLIEIPEILETLYEISIKLNLINIVDNSKRETYHDCPMKTPKELAAEANQNIMDFLTKHGLGYHNLGSNTPTRPTDE